MGCMASSTSQTHAFPNVFSLSPKVWTTQLWWSCQGNSSSWELFLYLTTGPFPSQHSQHEREFSLDVTQGLGPSASFWFLSKIPSYLFLFILLTQKHLQAGADSSFTGLKAHIIQEALFKKNAKSDLKTSICQNEEVQQTKTTRTSLVVWWLRLCTPNAGVRVRGLGRKPDSTCCN